MPDSDQILDKYTQLKLDLKLQEEEKQRKIQEELDAKNPLKQYEKIHKELAESKEKYSKEIKENIDKADEENRLKLEGIELFSLVSILKLGPLKGIELSSSCGLPKSIVKTVGSIISSTILHSSSIL